MRGAELSRLRRRRALAVLTGLLAAASLALLAPLPRPQPPLPVLDTLGGDFTLHSTLGRELSLGELRGGLVLLNFGFTQCPDVCPTVLARLRALLLELDALGIPAQGLFVTVDPARDGVDVLRNYVGYFHPSLVGLTGSSAEVDRVAARYRVLVEREAPAAPGADYGVAHSSHIYVIDADGRVRAMFSASHTLARMVDDVRRLDPNPLRRPWRYPS